MSLARLLSTGLLLGILASASCGTNAKGVEDCRSIEQARCSASAACGLVQSVDECERYYRDQCLHGLPVASPGSKVVTECVDAIRAAGTCAQSGQEADCIAPVTPDTACLAIERPERMLAECAFLDPGATDGEGGSSSTGGASSGGASAEGGNGDGSGGATGGSPGTTGGSASGGDSGSE